MKKSLKTAAAAAAALIVVIIGILLISNHMNADYENLSNGDQFILGELDQYVKAAEKQDIWKNYNLKDKTILAMKGSFGCAYLINPKEEVRSIFAKKIQMPADSKIEVYRISALSPQLMPLRFDGNFNTLGKKYRLFGNEVFFTRYDEEEAVTKKFTSRHYITYLAHEAFHYYMQNAWAEGSTFPTDGLTEQELSFLYREYEILGKIQKAITEEKADRAEYLGYAKAYTDAVKARLAANPDYVKKELERETIEGTATYIGIRASKLTGYDFGVMYFDNRKNVPFSEIKTAVREGVYEKSNLADRIPYESGALLCLLMDQLDIPGWQEKLNAQTKDCQITLYDIIKEFTEKES